MVGCNVFRDARRDDARHARDGDPQRDDARRDDPHRRRVVREPRIRRLVADGGRLGRGTNVVHGLTEIDVTAALQRLRTLQTDDEARPSLTGYVTWCLARTVAGTHMNAVRSWRGHTVVFDDVDVAMQFEIALRDGRRVIRPHILRRVNARSLEEITDEIRRVQTTQQSTPSHGPLRWFVLLPTWLRRLIMRTLLRTPGWARPFFGTVSVSAIGMFANRAGWGLPIPNHALQLTIGGMTRRPALIHGALAERDMLSVTVSIDHDVMDGAPAVRLFERFATFVERADGLPSRPQRATTSTSVSAGRSGEPNDTVATDR